jgi:ribokinase
MKVFMMILVFGSLNADLFLRVKNLPKAGETVLCPSYKFQPGGKGANQALAAACLGGHVEMIGSVGNDLFSYPVIDALEKAGVGIQGIKKTIGATGTACVMVEEGGENQIVVASGANLETTSDQVLDDQLTKTTILILQMEVPIAQIKRVIYRARKAECKIILNLAPAIGLDDEVLRLCDFLILNAGEADFLSGRTNSAQNHAQEFFFKYNAESIITLGNNGAVLANSDGLYWINALKVEAVDTVGAGDAFVGVFAASLDAGESSLSALSYATIAGSITCLAEGAQTDLLSSSEIKKNLLCFQPAELIKSI